MSSMQIHGDQMRSVGEILDDWASNGHCPNEWVIDDETGVDDVLETGGHSWACGRSCEGGELSMLALM